MTKKASTPDLSNSIIKVFIKKKKKIVFHLKTHLFIPTEKFFDSKMVRQLAGHFTLDDKLLKFEKAAFVTFGSTYDRVYDGRTKVVESYFSTVIDYRFFNHQLTDIEITIEYLLNGKIKRMTYRTTGLIRKMYDERILKERGEM